MIATDTPTSADKAIGDKMPIVGNLQGDKTASVADLQTAPCEQHPRQCSANSCRYYSTLYSECRYHDIRQERIEYYAERLGGRPC